MSDDDVDRVVIPDKTRVAIASDFPRSHGRNRAWVRLKSGAWSEAWVLRPFCPPFIPWFRDMSRLRSVPVAVDGEVAG